MERINKIPDDFLVETELTEEQISVFVEQINRFNELNTTYSNVCRPKLNSNGEIMFSKGTLIHGIGWFNTDKINGISKSGILTGQALGIPEEAETYYCADFWRVQEDISVEEYNINYTQNDGKCPFGGWGVNSVGFVVVPTEENKELLSYDCYREGTEESEITKSFVFNTPFDNETSSSILYGVPASCIEGIVVGENILCDKTKIDFIIESLPNCYIVSAYGELIYNPYNKETKDDEIVDLRREKAALERNNRHSTKQVESYKSKIDQLNAKYNVLWEQMLINCDTQTIAQILGNLGGNFSLGDILETATEMKKKASK